MDQNTTTIEINGVKLEVDLRTAVRIDTLRVGSRVKCLAKKYDAWHTCPGVVVGFDPFPTRPTIVVAYMDEVYGSDGLSFRSLNADTKDFEIVADCDNTALDVNRAGVLQQFERLITAAEAKVQELKDKQSFFVEKFGAFFSDKE